MTLVSVRETNPDERKLIPVICLNGKLQVELPKQCRVNRSGKAFEKLGINPVEKNCYKFSGGNFSIGLTTLSSSVMFKRNIEIWNLMDELSKSWKSSDFLMSGMQCDERGRPAVFYMVMEDEVDEKFGNRYAAIMVLNINGKLAVGVLELHNSSKEEAHRFVRDFVASHTMLES